MLISLIKEDDDFEEKSKALLISEIIEDLKLEHLFMELDNTLNTNTNTDSEVIVLLRIKAIIEINHELRDFGVTLTDLADPNGLKIMRSIIDIKFLEKGLKNFIINDLNADNTPRELFDILMSRQFNLDEEVYKYPVEGVSNKFKEITMAFLDSEEDMCTELKKDLMNSRFSDAKRLVPFITMLDRETYNQYTDLIYSSLTELRREQIIDVSGLIMFHFAEHGNLIEFFNREAKQLLPIKVILNIEKDLVKLLEELEIVITGVCGDDYE